MKNVFDMWKQAPKRKKVRMIVEVLTDIGSAILFSAIGKRACGECGKMKKAAVGLTTFGLSCYASRIASQEINHYVDLFAAGWEEAKRESEDQANA